MQIVSIRDNLHEMSSCFLRKIRKKLSPAEVAQRMVKIIQTYFDWHIIRIVLEGRYEYIVTHYENTPIQMYWKFYHPKIENFQIKKTLIFFTFLLKT